VALVRCEQFGKPKGTTNIYVRPVHPFGYPETAALCGEKGCENPGLVWLTQEEALRYEQGQRVFAGPSNVMKVRVE
jgi:hypothetical protein